MYKTRNCSGTVTLENSVPKDGVEHVLKVLQLKNKFTYTKDNDLNLIIIK